MEEILIFIESLFDEDLVLVTVNPNLKENYYDVD